MRTLLLQDPRALSPEQLTIFLGNVKLILERLAFGVGDSGLKAVIRSDVTQARLAETVLDTAALPTTTVAALAAALDTRFAAYAAEITACRTAINNIIDGVTNGS